MKKNDPPQSKRDKEQQADLFNLLVNSLAH